MGKTQKQILLSAPLPHSPAERQALARTAGRIRGEAVAAAVRALPVSLSEKLRFLDKITEIA